MDRSIIYRGEEDACRHGPRFRMQHDRIFFWIVCKVRHPEGHIVEAEFAEGGVEVHLQSRGFGGERRKEVGILRPRADKLGVVTACFLSGRLEGEFEGRSVEYS